MYVLRGVILSFFISDQEDPEWWTYLDKWSVRLEARIHMKWDHLHRAV